MTELSSDPDTERGDGICRRALNNDSDNINANASHQQRGRLALEACTWSSPSPRLARHAFERKRTAELSIT